MFGLSSTVFIAKLSCKGGKASIYCGLNHVWCLWRWRRLIDRTKRLQQFWLNGFKSLMFRWWLVQHLTVIYLDILEMSVGHLFAYLTEFLGVNYVRNLLDVSRWIFMIFCRTDSLNFLYIFSNWLVNFLDIMSNWLVWIFSIFCRIDSVNFLDILSNWLVWIFSIFCLIDSVNFPDIFSNWLD